MHSRLEANLCAAFPHDHAADAVQSLENRARYLAQSKATKAGARADTPDRDPACPLPQFRPVGRFVIHGED